ncbi:MAG: hypothetical protein V3U24_09330 [Candidatus Neomarinimicrobiota bacterium]
MAIETIPFREIEKHTKDMYEATVVVSKRARQIVADRMAEMELSQEEEEPGLLDEEPVIDEEYEEREKSTTLSLGELLSGDLEWSYATDDDEEDTDSPANME